MLGFGQISFPSIYKGARIRQVMKQEEESKEPVDAVSCTLFYGSTWFSILGFFSGFSGLAVCSSEVGATSIFSGAFSIIFALTM
mmetsp:Transcript_1055/g.2248  ORF Transcript_1055/g.2248 Transcript_1055/m.2248 type:complete len:84 (+) Transcript_1055:53-304(+)